MFRATQPVGLALALLVAAGAGCLPASSVTVSDHAERVDIEAERLRPDFQPLAGELPISRRSTFSDGNRYAADGSLEAVGASPISPLFFADMPGHLVHNLRVADCLWVDEGNEAGRLSYELVARNVEIEGETTVPEIGFCGGYAHDPATRRELKLGSVSESDIREGSGRVRDIYDVELTTWQGRAVADSTNTCDAGNPDIQRLRAVARSLRGTPSIPNGLNRFLDAKDYPFCMIQGALGRVDEDSSLRLDLIDSQTGIPVALAYGLDAPPMEVETRIKVVEPSTPGNEFLLSRPLRFNGTRETEHDGDLSRTAYAWVWSVETGATGRWRENFHPELQISRVRAYVDRGVDPDTGEPIREYLHPRRIRAYTQFDTAAPTRHLNCRVRQRQDAEPPACEDVEGMTPTFHRSVVGGRDSLSDRLTWEVRFDEVIEYVPVEQPDGTVVIEERVIEEAPKIGPDEPFFVEFHLVRPSFGTSASGLSVSPAVRDLGDMRVADRPVFKQALEVGNVGQGNLQIEDAWLTGANASDFAVELEGGLHRTLGQGERLPVHLSLVGGSRHHGRLEANLHVKARDTAGRMATVRATVVANAVDWIFDVAHPPLFLQREAGQHPVDDVLEFERPLLLLNNGALAMPRGQITITGSGAAHFSVVRADSEYLAPRDYVPWLWGEQPPALRSIEPGGMERLFVIYHPNHPGVRALRHGADEAEIRVRVDDVDYSIPVRGICTGVCQFQAPTPVGPPSRPGAIRVAPGGAAAPSGGVVAPHEALDLAM